MAPGDSQAAPEALAAVQLTTPAQPATAAWPGVSAPRPGCTHPSTRSCIDCPVAARPCRLPSEERRARPSTPSSWVQTVQPAVAALAAGSSMVGMNCTAKHGSPSWCGHLRSLCVLAHRKDGMHLICEFSAKSAMMDSSLQEWWAARHLARKASRHSGQKEPAKPQTRPHCMPAVCRRVNTSLSHGRHRIHQRVHCEARTAHASAASADNNATAPHRPGASVPQPTARCHVAGAGKQKADDVWAVRQRSGSWPHNDKAPPLCSCSVTGA